MGYPLLATIAFVAAAYHMTNHSFYKALLFLGASTVDANVGTRDLDLLGGLIRAMPWTALFFLVGAMSIAALPPFNGFVSEWLTLQTMLRSVELSPVGVKITFAICGAGLALTAALAVTCFVKAFAMGFLGMSRSARPSGPRRRADRRLCRWRCCRAVLGLGDLPDLRHSGARSCRGADVRVRRGQGPRPTVFRRQRRITSGCRPSLRPNSTT